MNNNNSNLSSCVFLLVAALVLVSASSSLVLPHNEIVEIQADGTLYCTPTGNPPDDGTESIGVRGVTIALICKTANDTIFVVAKGVTDGQGKFNFKFRVSIVTYGYLALRACDGIVDLPLVNSTCTSLPQTGLLAGGLRLERASVGRTKGSIVRVAKFFPLL